MSKNWKKIADEEFGAMDDDWQRDWQELRDRTNSPAR